MPALPDTTTGGRRILVVGGIARSLVNFRGDLIREFIRRGCRVTAAAGDRDAEAEGKLSEMGARFEPVRLARTGMNPVADFASLAALVGLMRRVRPDIFCGYTIKPVVYGLLAARLTGVPRRVAMIEGLGYAFTEGAEARRRFVRQALVRALRFSLPLADALIVLNRDDEAFLRDGSFTSDPRRVVRIPGIGVDTVRYALAPLPDGPLTFLMVSRLLRDKGVRQFAEAARIVKQSYPRARFVLIGPHDANLAAVPASEVEAWVREGIIDYRGAVGDVRPEFAASHVFVLPTWYREGMPRTILEAMAMGRPVVTTDTPGCRETVIEDKTGLLVPPRDSVALAAALVRFARDREFIQTAGAAGRAFCDATFASRIVVPRTADIVLGE